MIPVAIAFFQSIVYGCKRLEDANPIVTNVTLKIKKQNQEEWKLSNNNQNARMGLTVKDLVTTGIFTALLFVFNMIGGVFFATNPTLTFFMPAGSALLCGPVYLLLVAKVPKRWSISIMSILLGIIWFVSGMHWALPLGYIMMGIIADFVAGIGQYRSRKINIISYMLFMLGATGPYLVFFINPEGWAKTMLKNGTEQTYIDSMKASANAGILIAMFAAVLITSAVSAFVGSMMLRKQFEKAGITA